MNDFKSVSFFLLLFVSFLILSCNSSKSLSNGSSNDVNSKEIADTDLVSKYGQNSDKENYNELEASDKHIEEDSDNLNTDNENNELELHDDQPEKSDSDFKVEKENENSDLEFLDEQVEVDLENDLENDSDQSSSKSLCDGISCKDNGKCIEKDDKPVCECYEGYSSYDNTLECINETNVPCKDLAPVNAHSIVEDVTISFTEDAKWSTPDACKWECDEGSVPIEGGCKEEIDFLPITINKENLITSAYTLDVTGEVEVKIYNSSEADSKKPYMVTVFEDVNLDGKFDINDTVLGEKEILAPHKSKEYINLKIQLTGKMSFKDNNIHVFTDSKNNIEEIDENNNIISSNTSCSMPVYQGTFEPVLEWEWTSSVFSSDWDQVMATPIVINLTDDNKDNKIDEKDIPEIIFTTFKGNGYRKEGVLRAISGDGDGEIFTIDVSKGYELASSATPAGGDIDGDGVPEILVTTLNKTLIAFNNDGSFKWESGTINNFSPYISGPSLADIDHDGKSEIVVGRTVVNHDGTIRWVGAAGAGRGDSCIVDLDLDGNPEIISGNTAYRADGSIYWQNNDAKPHSFCAVADFDKDSYPEVITVGSGFVTMINYKGATVYGPIDIPPSGTVKDQGGAPVIADFDNDGVPEIGIAGGYNYVVFESDMTVKWTKDTKDLSSNVTGSSVFDFNGDGNSEVVYADETYLRVYSGKNGDTLFKIPIGSGTLSEYPLIVDVDNDNSAEIVIASNDYAWGPKTGIQVYGDFNDGWVNTRKIWNQYSYHNTNVNENGGIPKYERNHCASQDFDSGLNSYRQNSTSYALGCKDISASKATITELIDNSFDLNVRIGNGGSLYLAKGVNISLYQGDPDIGGTFIALEMTTQRLHPGEYVDVVIKVKNFSGDKNDLFIIADDDGSGHGKIREINEKNNKLKYIP